MLLDSYGMVQVQHLRGGGCDAVEFMLHPRHFAGKVQHDGNIESKFMDKVIEAPSFEILLRGIQTFWVVRCASHRRSTQDRQCTKATNSIQRRDIHDFPEQHAKQQPHKATNNTANPLRTSEIENKHTHIMMHPYVYVYNIMPYKYICK